LDVITVERTGERGLGEPPLVVDLDGLLLRSSLKTEARIALFRANPARMLSPAQWRPPDTAVMHQLLEAGALDVSAWPYNRAAITAIETERARGRRVVLAHASQRIADAVARHLGIFDEVTTTATAGSAASLVAAQPTTLRDWLKALRIHQWLKNLLIMVPLLAAHRYTEVPLLWTALLAFVAFGLCASSVYVLNDLIDLPDDRHHVRKRNRPFAAGRISVGAGILAFPLLLLAAFTIAVWQLPVRFIGVLGFYYLLTLSYSLVLKRRMVFDVIALAGLYTLRVVAGSVGLSIPLTFWLLALSMFMFLSLALVKRYAELFHMRADGDEVRARGRGYFRSDLQMIASLGAASGYMAVLVLALYINDMRTAELYGNVKLIWLACPLLLTWISRVWMMTHRGFMDEDPVIFAIKDRISLALGLLIALVFWLAA
jgi:4-hydroxybenzoate polyprenyltransferase